MVERDIEATSGLVPEFFRRVPDSLLPTEWASFKSLELSDQTAIANEYKELIGLALSSSVSTRPKISIALGGGGSGERAHRLQRHPRPRDQVGKEPGRSAST